MRDPEIAEHSVSALKEDVFGLHVAVDDAMVVGDRECVGDLAQEAQRVAEWQASLALESVS